LIGRWVRSQNRTRVDSQCGHWIGRWGRGRNRSRVDSQCGHWIGRWGRSWDRSGQSVSGDGVRVIVGIGEGNGSQNCRWEQASCGSRVNKAK
jgi:hypothetical protein